MKEGGSVQGLASTTRTSSDKKEFLIVHTTDGQQEVDLEQIKSMQALSPNPHFQRIDF